jgi:hypothetical protein
MDMHAIRQGELLRVDALRAAKSGADLLLVTSDPQDQTRVYEALVPACKPVNTRWMNCKHRLRGSPA